MRSIKFNHFERVAGAFVILAFIGAVVTVVVAAVKKGWFENKIHYTAIFETADGLYEGTSVQIAGLRAGAVTKVELDSENKIAVDFYILGKYQQKIRNDSTVQLIRPFVIGEKVIDVSMGSARFPTLEQYSRIPSVDSFDFMSLASGKNMNIYAKNLSGVFASLKTLGSALSDPKRIEGMVKTLDRMESLVNNLNTMSSEVTKLSKQATKDDSFRKLVENMTSLTSEMNKVLPEMVAANPEMAKDIGRITQDIATMTQALAPAIQGVQGQLPQATLRLIQALDETVVTLRAMQKNVFMRGNVDEVRQQERERMPAEAK